ncbi:uncharacterized [Tachysurus ichikawai]
MHVCLEMSLHSMWQGANSSACSPSFAPVRTLPAFVRARQQMVGHYNSDSPSHLAGTLDSGGKSTRGAGASARPASLTLWAELPAALQVGAIQSCSFALLLAPWHWFILRCLDRILCSRLDELWATDGAWASCFKVRKGPSSLPPPLGACCLPLLGHTKRKQQAQRRCLFPLTQIPVL